MSKPSLSTRLIAFSEGHCVAEGLAKEVLTNLKSYEKQHPERNLLILDAVTSHTIELDLRDSEEAILASQFDRSASTKDAAVVADKTDGNRKKARGRPKLGVVSREITLLPRHWEWLSSQPGGASVALRKLVDRARQSNSGPDRQRAARDSAYRCMTVLAGDAPGYEEAIRRLYAKDLPGLLEILASWSPDVARHVESLARASLPEQ